MGRYAGGELYLIRDRVLWFPDGDVGVQCVARTKKRKRCLNDLLYATPVDQQTWWDRGTVGEVHDVKHATRSKELAYRMYEQQRCYVHVDGDGPDQVAPEWEVYAPHRHRRTRPCPVDLRCETCDFLAITDQVLIPRLGPCPACGHTAWLDLGRNRWAYGRPGWPLVKTIPIAQRPVLSLTSPGPPV